ncbi:MAG: hypothetical protein V4455_14920, partial [Pseudomonadota bacterium]
MRELHAKKYKGGRVVGDNISPGTPKNLYRPVSVTGLLGPLLAGFIGGVPLLLPVLLWQPVRPAMGQFDVLGADIGQGNAVIVRTAGHSLVYDTGPR